jgi:MerR family transcriptional regulator/heat shock protein HspR
VRDLEHALAEERLQRPERRVFAAGSAGGEVITLRRGTRVRRNAEVVVWKP